MIIKTFFPKRNAYREAVEVFKEGKALPRWVENVVITASKIKGCSIDEDEVEDDDDEGEDSSICTPAEADTNLDPSYDVNGHSSLNKKGNK